MRLFCGGASRFHDWSADGRAAARRILERARDARLIGPVQWYAAAPEDERREVPRDDGVLEGLLDRPDPPRRTYGINAGGSRPAPWELAMQLPRWIEEDRQAQGINLIKLWLDDDEFRGVSGSDALIRAFRAIHGPENTEAAFIHPYESWVKLTDVVMDGAYGDPLTLGPMFPGVMWASFLGRGHLAFFDVTKLRQLEAHQIEWIGEDGLFIRVCADVRDAAKPEVEREMLRLTSAMRRALR